MKLWEPPISNIFEIKTSLDLPQISTDDHTGLRSFHQQLKLLITWLESLDNISSADSIENMSKAVIRLPKNLRSQFYEDFKENKFSCYHKNLKDFERWFRKNMTNSLILYQQ